MSYPDDEAVTADLYLDWLLATHGGTAAPALVSEQPLDPALVGAVTVLDASLVRFHPSFRFEERLAATLAATAEGVTGAGEPIVLGHRHGDALPLDRRGRGLLLSGAIASGVSLAGAALFAWRRTRPPATTFRRAVRAARAVQRPSRSDRSRVRPERLA
jgi:hypothetical protein